MLTEADKEYMETATDEDLRLEYHYVRDNPWTDPDYISALREELKRRMHKS